MNDVNYRARATQRKLCLISNDAVCINPIAAGTFSTVFKRCHIASSPRLSSFHSLCHVHGE